MCLKAALLDEIEFLTLVHQSRSGFHYQLHFQRVLGCLNHFQPSTIMSFLVSLCFVMFSECVVGVCFQERSLSCVKQMAVGDPSLSIPVYANICSSILVRVYSCFSKLNACLFFFIFLSRGVLLLLLVYHTVISKCAQLLSITDVLFPGEKPHHCGICGKTFSQSGSRNVHMRKRHGEEGLSGEGKETGSSYPTRAALGGPVNPGIMSLRAAHAF